MATNEGRVYFALDGDNFNPNELSNFLGITPTSIKLKGDTVPGKLPKHNSWIVSSDNIINEYIDVFDMASEICKILEPKIDLIIKAKEKFDLTARLEVVLTISMDKEASTPAIGFESDTVEFLGKIGASIDIDTYKH